MFNKKQCLRELITTGMALSAITACALNNTPVLDGDFKPSERSSPRPGTATPRPSTGTPTPIITEYPRSPDDPRYFVLGKTEKDVIAKRESYVYKVALPNADFSKMLYRYDTIEEVDFNDKNKSSARRTVNSGLWLFDRATNKNEKLPETMQLGDLNSVERPILWLDSQQVLGMSTNTKLGYLKEEALVILDLAQGVKKIISTAIIDTYFIQGNFVYYLAGNKVYQYDLQSEQSKPLALPTAAPEFPTSGFKIAPYQGEQIVISKSKPKTQIGKYDFSVKLSPSAPPAAVYDYYLYNTRNAQARVLTGAVDYELDYYARNNLLFSPNFQRYTISKKIYESAGPIDLTPMGSPYLWLSDTLLLSVDFETKSNGEKLIKKVYIQDLETWKNIFESSFPTPCKSLYKAEHNRILGFCNGQVLHLTGTPAQPGEFVPLFSPPLYASLGSDYGLDKNFGPLAPIFVVKKGQAHFADIMGLSPMGELVSKFKLLPPEKPDFVFEAPAEYKDRPDQWQTFFRNTTFEETGAYR